MEKRKRSLILIIVLLILLIFVFGVAYIYFFTNILKTSGQLFEKYLASNVLQIYEIIVEPYKNVYKRIEKEPTEISINDEKLGSISLKTDIPKKTKMLNVNINSYFKLDFLITDKIYGIYSEELYNRYITLENRNLKKVAKTINIDEDIIDMIPEKFPNQLFSKKNFKKIAKIVRKNFINEMNKLDKSSYTNENYEDEFDGKNLKGNKYILTISNIKLQEIIETIFYNTVKDKKFIALSKVELSDKSINLIKERIYKELNINNKREENTIKIAIYEFNGKTIKTEIYSNDDNEHKAEIYILNKHIQIKIPQPEIDGVTSEILVNVNSASENTNREIIAKINKIYNKNDIENVKKSTEEAMKRNTEDFEENPYSDDFNADYVYDMYTDSIKTYKIATSYENNIMTSKISYKTDEESERLLTNTIKFGIDMEVPDLNNKTVINRYTKIDYINLVNEIVPNIRKKYEEKPGASFITIITLKNFIENI